MSKLKIAIQKSGRLSENSLNLLKECGIKFPNGGGKLITESTNFPIEILFLRDDDIPQYVEQKVADIGIIGENVFVESAKQIDIIENLGFSSCRLSLAVPKEIEYSDLSYFNGKKVATSYPVILENYFQQNNIKAIIDHVPIKKVCKSVRFLFENCIRVAVLIKAHLEQLLANIVQPA